MAKYLIEDTTLTGIADAIRAKTGITDPIAVADMASQIAAITGGGSEETLTTLFEAKPCNGFSLDSTIGVYAVNLSAAYTLVVGESYIVEWDGETYNCVAQDLSFLAAGVVGLGNFAGFGGTGNGEPFGFLYSATGCTICALDTATAHDVGLYQKQSSGGGSVEGIVYVTFMNGSVELCKTACMKGDCSIDPVECAKIAVPTKEPTVDTVYTYAGGWALTDGGEADVAALVDVNEDRVVYAAYTEGTRYYTVRFFDGDTLVDTVQVQYGETAETDYEKDGYTLNGWVPSNENITADTDCYGDFEEGLVTFANSSWARISEMCEAGRAAEFFAVGDTRSVVGSDGETTYNLRVIGIDLDTKSSGGKAGLTVIVTDAADAVIGFGSDTALWAGSSLRSVCRNFADKLPDDLTSVIKSVEKVTTKAVMSGTTVSGSASDTSTETIFTPSIYEMGLKWEDSLTGTSVPSKESIIYLGLDTAAERTITLRDGTAKEWFTRTAAAQIATHIIGKTGVQTTGYKSSQYGYVPTFCI